MADSIPSLLQTIARDNIRVSILCVYKGLSVSNATQILQVTDSLARVQVDKYQAVSMFTDRFTFLQSNLLPEIVRADVLKLDLPNQSATLGNFKYMTNGIGNRKVVRVKPKNQVDGEITDKRFNRLVRAELADISHEGMAIYIPRAEYKAWQFSEGVQAIITLRLPGEFDLPAPKTANTGALSAESLDRFSRSNVRFNPAGSLGGNAAEGTGKRKVNDPQVSVQSTVMNIHFESSHARYRLGLKVSRDELYSMLVAQFIAQRQSEIIREVQWMYDLIVKQA